MEEQPDSKTERSASQPLKLDFTKRQEPEEGPRSRKALVWGGLVLALLLMFAGTAVSTMAPKAWKPVGLYLFMASAILYLVCRCMTLGILNTTPKVFAILLMLTGCFVLSKWPPTTPLGILGIACLVAAFALVFLFGFGYLRREGKKRTDAT